MPTTEHSGESESTAVATPVSPLTSGALNLPNAITISRLVLSVVLFVLIDIDGYWQSAAVVFIIAAGTDFLDGWIARRYGLVTTLGRILDPFVDKIIICGAFIFLLGNSDSGVTAWMTLVVVGREMFVTSLRAFMEQHGMDFSATWSGKWKMAAQCAAVLAVLLSLSAEVENFTGQLDQIRDILLWAAVVLTVYSGVVYVFRAAHMIRDRSQPVG